MVKENRSKVQVMCFVRKKMAAFRKHRPQVLQACFQRVIEIYVCEYKNAGTVEMRQSLFKVSGVDMTDAECPESRNIASDLLQLPFPRASLVCVELPASVDRVRPIARRWLR